MRKRHKSWKARWIGRVALLAAFVLLLQSFAPAVGYGMTQADRQVRLYLKRRQVQQEVLPVRVLRKWEMEHLRGRGRMPQVAGQAKWDVVEKGVNLRTRNYTYTANELSLPGAVGIPVSVVRTFNAHDDREGPFGIGWSWSLDVRQAAGGLIKRRASPSRSVATQMNNGRRLVLVKWVVNGNSVSQQITEHDGAAVSDASGEQWLVWRDADGLYTPPPWDQNEYESRYTTVRWSAQGYEYEREYALSTKVTTPDGTVYEYEAVFQADGKPVVLVEDGAGGWMEAYSEQVLKRVRDRHGNQTVYEYLEVAHVPHTYYDLAGNLRTVMVRKAFVKEVRNANGFVLRVNWNFEGAPNWDFAQAPPRVVLVQSSDGRTVQYGYGPWGDEFEGPQDWSGSVTAVKSPAGWITRYEYTNWHIQQDYWNWLPNNFRKNEDYLLSKVTDADGVWFQVSYNNQADPLYDPYWYRVAVSAVQEPSGAVTFYDYWDGINLIPVRKDYGNREVVNRRISFGEGDNQTYGVEESYVSDDLQWRGYLARTRIYDQLTAQLQEETHYLPDVLLDWNLPDFAMFAEQEDVRTLPLMKPSFGGEEFQVLTYPEYNCFGQPLRVEQEGFTFYWDRGWIGGRGFNDPDFTYTQTVAYWGKEKYFQKKLEIDPKGRKVFYDYYARHAPQGYRGQLKAVYAEPYSQFVQRNGEWVPAPGTTPVSEVLEYNERGQVTLSRALQQAGANPRWVYTQTQYESLFGQPASVIEDVNDPTGQRGHPNGVNRINTTTYDPFGRVVEQSTYTADGQVVRTLKTVYLDADGLVQEVQQVAPVFKRLLEYTYTAAGRTERVRDLQSGVSHQITYELNTGRVQSTQEYWGGTLRYQVEYTYAGADLWKKSLTVYNRGGQGEQTWVWRYLNYKTGYLFPLQRVFTRVVVEPPVGVSPYPIVVDYVYEQPSFRLRAARFGVVPMKEDEETSDGCKTLALDLLTQPLGAQCPKRFAFAWYVYDPLGRVVDLRYYQVERQQDSQGRWTSEYRYSPLTRWEYFRADADNRYSSGYDPRTYVAQYDAVGNRLWMRALDYPNGETTPVRTEQYQYDALDRLVGVSYNGGSPQTWRYDVMGNRSNGGETWVYDGLNRLVSRPGVSYQHDWLGNRLSDNLWTYRWDGLKRLVGMSPKPGNRGKVWSYVYRGDGLRVKRVSYRKEVGLGFGLQEGSAVRKPVWETDYLYDGQMPVCEQDYEDGVLKQTRVNFLGARGIEAIITVDHTRNDQASLQWLFYDAHGNVVRTMSNDGLFRLSAFQWRGVWGERESDLGLGKGYCANLGHPEDETGLVYMRARYYEPATGRFISEDPSQDGVNWYLYADGNPLAKVDFTGEFFLGLASLMDIMIAITELVYSRTLKDTGDIAAAQAARSTLTNAFLKHFEKIKEWLDVIDDMSDLLEYHETKRGGYSIKNPGAGKQVHVDFDTSHHGYPHFDLQDLVRGGTKRRLPF